MTQHNASATRFFICGSPKSGTTWVQLLLNRHPAISCVGESHLVPLLARIAPLFDDHNRMQRERNERIFAGIDGFPPFPEIDAEDRRVFFDTLLSRMMAKAATKPEFRAIGEKTPEIVEQLDLLLSVVPDARIIHVIRDGRDVAVSSWHHLLRNAPPGTDLTGIDFPRYMPLAAKSWNTLVRMGRAWGRAHPERYLELRYEALHADPDRVLEGLFAFLGVPSDAAIRADCVAATAFEALSGRAAGQEDRQSFLRKGVPGDWQNWFDARLNDVYLTIAGDLMAELGYVPPRAPQGPMDLERMRALLMQNVGG